MHQLKGCKTSIAERIIQRIQTFLDSGDSGESLNCEVWNDSAWIRLTPDITLIGTGSELHLCLEAAAQLEGHGHKVRVVSMPSVERFQAQDEAYRDSVLPSACPLRLSVEAGTTSGWAELVGDLGQSVGINTFGESAPASDLAEHFGFTTANVTARALDMLGSFRANAELKIAALQGAMTRGA